MDLPYLSIFIFAAWQVLVSLDGFSDSSGSSLTSLCRRVGVITGKSAGVQQQMN